MQIISPFKDYYDVGMQYGFDPKLQWIRRTSDIEESSRWHHSESIILHFCGKTYRGIVVKSASYYINSMEVIWDNEHYDKYCTENKVKPLEISWLDKFWITTKVRPKSKIIQLGLIGESDILNDKYSSPVILQTNKGLEINPSLKFIQFYKVYDPVTTYQKISEYFGNKFFNEPKMVPISDKDRIKQHGFTKESFRMAKSSNK
jgi:hypothetical protein